METEEIENVFTTTDLWRPSIYFHAGPMEDSLFADLEPDGKPIASKSYAFSCS
jgi:hypothetical protein